jgi:hypothetical protein
MKVLDYTQFINEATQIDNIEVAYDRVLDFDGFVTEAKDVASLNPRLNKAADIVASYVNKKTALDFKKFPFTVFYTIDGVTTEGIMFYSNKSDAAFRVTGPQGNTPGVIGALEFSQDHASGRVDFSLSSDNFPIVALLNEFTLMINDKSYADKAAAVTEALELVEESSKYNFSSKEIKEIQNLLANGTPATQVAEQMDIPYRAIVKLKRNLASSEAPTSAEVENEMTLQDKVKYLDETLEDIYQISRRVAAGAFNSLFISGRAGTGKTYNVERAMNDEGLVEEDDYIMVSGAVSPIMMYKKMYQYRNKTLIFDDCDSVFRDENGRNMLKAALDTKKIRKISWLKKSSIVFDPKDVEMDPEAEFNMLEQGMVPAYFEFAGRVIFISNLKKDVADPDGAIRSRSILIDVDPDDATLMERMRALLPHLEPRELPLKDKEEIYEFMKEAKDISMRTFVKAAGFKMAGLANWKRMASRYL